MRESKFEIEFSYLIEPKQQMRAARFIFNNRVSVYCGYRQNVYNGLAVMIDTAGNFGLETDAETGSTLDFEMSECVINPAFK